MLTDEKAHDLYKRIKDNGIKYDEAKHCALILKIMGDPRRARMTAFCAEVGIGEDKFYKWIYQHELFFECYAVSKMLAREIWEEEGERIKNYECQPGTSNYLFEHWRMVGWARFGVGKNSRVRLNLNPNNTPEQHYKELLFQASQGDFTAGEIKQLMEAINVGLNAHQVFKLQQEINELKENLIVMNENTHGDDSRSVKRIKKED